MFPQFLGIYCARNVPIVRLLSIIKTNEILVKFKWLLTPDDMYLYIKKVICIPSLKAILILN